LDIIADAEVGPGKNATTDLLGDEEGDFVDYGFDCFLLGGT